MNAQSNSKDNHPKTLRADVVGLIGATTLGTVMLSPAMTIYGNFGPSFVSAGKAVPLAFILGLAATLPTAISYALLSREYPESGSAASWIARVSPEWVGKWAGWIVFLYYFNNFIIQPVTIGVFLNDLLSSVGASSNWATFAVGSALFCILPAWLAYRGISVSTHGALVFLLFETLVVTTLCLTVFKVVPHDAAHFTLEGFKLPQTSMQVSGLWQAMIFAMLSYCGFDVISTLSEETRMPRRLIPQATFLSLLIFGALMIAGMWCLTFASTPERLRAVADAGGMPISEIARNYWGRWSVLVPLTAISAALGISIATAVGSSRVLFSMGRSGLASSVFAKIHPHFRVPWNAMHFVFVVGVASALVTGVIVGPYRAYVWWGTTSTFFAMITYFMVNSANLLLFRSGLFKSPLNLFLHLVVPVLGIGADLYILIRAFFIESWRQGWTSSGRSVILFDVACAAFALWLAFRKVRRSAPGHN